MVAEIISQNAHSVLRTKNIKRCKSPAVNFSRAFTYFSSQNCVFCDNYYCIVKRGNKEGTKRH